MSEELPSINDFIEDKSNLPSVETFTEGALPVQESVVEKKEDNIAEESIPQVIREQPDNTALIVSLIESVRNSIPEVKSYDQELYDIVKLIEQLKNDVEESKTEKTVLMESNGYDKDVLREELNDIRNSIPTVPEVKYYDEEIKELQESAKREYEYGEQYKKLTETVLDVRDRANVDHSWIRSTFSNIDDNFDSVTSSLATVKGKLEMEVSDILESMETTAFETKVDRSNLNKKIDDTQKEFSEATEVITSNVVEFKDKIYKELKEASLRIWNINKAYQKDDVKLQEQLDQQYSKLKESIAGAIESGDKKYDKLNRFYDILKEQIIDLPEIKNYDEEIKRVDHSVYTIKNLVTEIDRRLTSKVNKIKLDMKEGLLNIPPNLDNEDPLTPLDQNFATLEDLSNHYRLFMNRIQTQLATLGGGGAVWLWDLDDVNVGVPDGSGYPPIPEGTLLIYDASANNWVGIASTDLSPNLTLDDILQNGNISGYGMSVGVVTATDMFVSGNVNIGGTLTYEDVKNVDAIGLITARSGIDVTGGSVDIQSGNLNVSGISTFDGNITVKSDRIFFSGGSQLIRLSDNKGSALKIENQDGASQDFLDFKTSNSGPQLIFGAPNQVNNTITVGADDTGHDVIFYGDTSGSYLQWDQSADALQLLGDASLKVTGVSTLGVTSVTDLTARNLDVTGIATFGTTSVVIDGNNDLINVGTALTLGSVEGVLTPSLVVSGVSTIGIVTGVTSLEVGTVYATTSRISGDVIIDGDVSIAGTLTKKDVTEINSVGMITANSGINVVGGAVTVAAGDVYVSGIVSATSFIGDGSGLTGLANTDRITAESLVVLGVSTLATVNATSFIGPLTGSSTLVGGVSSTFLLNYNNFTNIPTNLSDFTNGPGYVTNSVTGNFAVSGNLSIGGTLTYEDVQNVDSVGIVTAGKGVRVTSGGLVVTGVSTLGTLGVGGDLTITDTDTGSAAGPELTLFRNSSSPDDGDYLGQLMFKGRNDNGGEENYAKVTGKISDASLGTEDGLIETAIKGNGSFTIVSRQRSSKLELINGVGIDIDGDLTLDNVGISSIISSAEAFVDNDTSLMTAAAIKDLIPSGFSGAQGQFLQHTGSEVVGVSSVGIATFINNYHQGYYRYTTDYYTTGTANTSQTLPADTFVLVQPQVRTNRTKFMPQKMLDVNNSDPWVGTGATIGTGQTTFSLAGLDAGSTVIVRIAAQFDPDVDNTNLDFKLEFTTNPTTQGFGVTNFSVTREQALICNEGADQPYISETLINFYVGNSLSGLTTADAGKFSLHARASDEGEFEMMALTINVVA